MITVNFELKDSTDITKINKYSSPKDICERCEYTLGEIVSRLTYTEIVTDEEINLMIELSDNKPNRNSHTIIEYSDDSLADTVSLLADRLSAILDRPVSTKKAIHSDCDIKLTGYNIRTLEDKQKAVLQMEKDIKRMEGYMHILPITVTEQPHPTEQTKEQEELADFAHQEDNADFAHQIETDETESEEEIADFAHLNII